MRIFLLVPLCVALSHVMVSPATASRISEQVWDHQARSALRALNEAIDEELPPLTEALPGYRPPGGDAISLAVVPFSSGPGEPSGLGMLFTFLLKHRLVESAGYALEMSSMWQRQYARVVYAGEESFFLPEQDQGLFLQRLRDRTGADFGLTGSVAERDGLVHASLRLQRLSTGDSILVQDYQLPAKALTSLLEGMIRSVLAELEIDVARPDMLRQQHPGSLEALRGILATRCDVRNCKERQAHLHSLLQQTPFPSAFIWLSEASEWGDQRAVDALQFGLSLWQDHALLAYARALHMPRGVRSDPNRERMGLLSGLAARYPDFLEFQFQAVADLAWCCYTRESLAIARSVLLRHPDHYRAWLIYTHSLSRYAWNIRGNHQWSRVPARGKRQFPRLMPLIESAVERSLSLNEYEPDAWVNRAVHPPGATEQTRAALLRAIELSPHDSWAYEAGMLNFRPVWGGSIDEQMRFFELAVENNPDAQWPFELHRSTYVQGSKWRVRASGIINRLGCGRGCRTYLSWIIAFLFFLLLPLALLIWHRKKQGYF